MTELSRNRLFNSKNPYQGDAKKVLCVCSAGLLRSPTTARVLQEEYGYNTRAAGIDTGHALIPVDVVLLHWADEIVCMDEQQQSGIRSVMDHMKGKNAHLEIDLHETPIHVLNIPDMYAYNEPMLRERVLLSYKETVNE